jgi:phage baseplate assembly protein W
VSLAYDVTATSLVIDWAPADEKAEILQNVRFILGTVAGTVPLARGMGVESDAVDGPASKARALLMTSVLRAIQRNEPRARVLEIYLEDGGALNGQFTPRVRIAI